MVYKVQFLQNQQNKVRLIFKYDHLYKIGPYIKIFHVLYGNRKILIYLLNKFM